jgi:type IV secretory pathway VirB10-like protein
MTRVRAYWDECATLPAPFVPPPLEAIYAPAAGTVDPVVQKLLELQLEQRKRDEEQREERKLRDEEQRKRDEEQREERKREEERREKQRKLRDEERDARQAQRDEERDARQAQRLAMLEKSVHRQIVLATAIDCDMSQASKKKHTPCFDVRFFYIRLAVPQLPLLHISL